MYRYFKFLTFSKGIFSLFLKKRKRFNKIISLRSKFVSFFTKLPLFLFSVLYSYNQLFIYLKYSTNFVILIQLPLLKFSHLFSYFFFYKLLIFHTEFRSLQLNYIFLFNINSTILLLKNYNKSIAQYSKSFSSFSKILGYLHKIFFVIVQLPSLKLKIFHYLSTAFILYNDDLKINIKLKNSKAGFFHNLGYLPTVRGVAKNPVDHPHGGRTKSLKCPKTP